MREVVLGSVAGSLTSLQPVSELTRAQAVALILRAEAAIAGFERSAPAIISIVPDAGSTTGGEEVVITGYDLTGATNVKFGTADAADVAVNTSGTLITCTTPAHAAGVASVTVLSPAAGVSNALTYTYTATPANLHFTDHRPHEPCRGGSGL